jgi:glucosamine--fructose-6-phosphate aminotransferase (isomerizing)
MDCSGRIAIAHNGIIENYAALRARLEQTGHTFLSDTDTEVLAHLIEETPGDTLEAKVISALYHVEGTYGLTVMSASEPGKIVAARNGSPVLIGLREETEEYYIASDASAVLEHTKSVIYLDDGDVAVITSKGCRVIDHGEHELTRRVSDLDWELDAIELGDFPHYMLKEIHEQPAAADRTMRGRLLTERASTNLSGLNLTENECRSFERVVILACGTSWHAGLIGRHIIERLAGIPVQVEYASEYHHHVGLMGKKTLAIAISQSGETADTLDAMRVARLSGARLVGIVNAVGSTIAREADAGIYLHAGPEIGVASTKAFTSQIVALLMLGLHLGRIRGFQDAASLRLIAEMERVPELIAKALEVEPEVRALAERYHAATNCLYLGRGINFPVALEGALKLKEISYIHAEGYPAAEMKHGPIALIDREMPVVVLAPQDGSYSRVLANIQEVKARGGRVIVVRTGGAESLASLADDEICVPRTSSLVSPLVTVIPLQLLAYHIAVIRGCDVDRPRNLAKSVTVA